jgi:hypothetical protein
MSKILHCHISVRGFLGASDSELGRMLSSVMKPGGERFASVHEFRHALMDDLAKGREALPVGEPCDGFDFKTGCPGHQVERPAPLSLPSAQDLDAVAAEDTARQRTAGTEAPAV